MFFLLPPQTLYNKKIKNTKKSLTLIGILASVTLASLSDMQKKAQVAKVLQDVKAIELALQMWGMEDNWNKWPFENEITTQATIFGGSGVTFNAIFQQESGFAKAMGRMPEPPFGTYVFDHDSGQNNNCLGGANIIWIVDSNTTDYAQSLHDLSDTDGDLYDSVARGKSCVYGGSLNFFFHLSDETVNATF